MSGKTRVLGLDVGEKRIGLAISDPMKTTAQPLTVIKRQDTGDEITELKRIVKDKEIGEVVVGLPLTLDGRMGPQAKRVAGYADRLSGELGVPVRLWDERLTTIDAERVLISAKVKRARRRRVVDKIAAAMILQAYLAAERREGIEDGQ